MPVSGACVSCHCSRLALCLCARGDLCYFLTPPVVLCALLVAHSAVFSADLRDPVVRLDAATSLLQRISGSSGSSSSSSRTGGEADLEDALREVAMWCIENVTEDQIQQWALSRGRTPLSAYELLCHAAKPVRE
jgi:hypothetical protein